MNGSSSRARRPWFRWSALLWWLIYPQRRQRTLATGAGGLLIVLSLGVGTAAYNAANNILFITLSLLLACLILSGMLAWLNIRRVTWDLQVAPPLRVGQEAVVALQVRNPRTLLPVYGLAFDLVARTPATGPAAKAESTLTGRGLDVRAALKQADAVEGRGRLQQPGRLDAGGEMTVEWLFKPVKRGRLRFELEKVVSSFPFGFLRKHISGEQQRDVVVWPPPVAYRRFPVAAVRRPLGGERVARLGSSNDLLALRRYAPGDSHRMIHWKASARTGRLLVRQFAAESTEGFALWLHADPAVWTRTEQRELLVGFAATLAEDLFRAEKLSTVALGTEPPVPVRRVSDLEAFLDRLALLDFAGATPALPAASGPAAIVRRKNLITFAPDGPNGAAAYVDGERLAAT